MALIGFFLALKQEALRSYKCLLNQQQEIKKQKKMLSIL
jgi:hypothetical protein